MSDSAWLGENMFVINGKEMWLRNGVDATLKRNGTFIDVWFVRDGRKQFVSVPVRDLEQILAKPNHGDAVDGTIEFDTRISPNSQAHARPNNL